MRLFSTLLSTLGSASMNHEEIVLQHYPHADSVYDAPIFHHGQTSACCPGEWVIFAQPSGVDRELGRGPTEEAAWEDAAKNIAAQMESGDEAA